ncbi:ATP-binding cassette domain-containing protein [Francisella sp. 19X1-34]|uniref:ATP-binding cassette domain-containing protein n=1 Tax=Francisella sp. 19X1-34 TaxID=3087177 RepID=UPI002E31042D|nr:ATP-binding cassette domain-containing protein [Francisella sp. 19X1-34]MED7788612.1 ATP-binding cassette domain-containing protein [Francisella sp. 19X1-34]
MLTFNISDHISKNFTINIQYQLSNSEIVAFFGPSGTGKSSILKRIVGTQKATESKITLNNNIWQSDSYFLPLIKRSLGYVPQKALLLPHLTVEKNLKYNKTKNKNHITKLIDLFEISELLKSYPSQLSGGQLQKVAIAQALSANPEVLILDESFSGIDFDSKLRLMKKLKDYIKKNQIITLLSTHDFLEISVFTDKVVIINNGSIKKTMSSLEFIDEYYKSITFLQKEF